MTPGSSRTLKRANYCAFGQNKTKEAGCWLNSSVQETLPVRHCQAMKEPEASNLRHIIMNSQTPNGTPGTPG